MADLSYNPNQDVIDAIQRSKTHSEIVTLPYTERRHAFLIQLQQLHDFTDAGDVEEFYGGELGDVFGPTNWRVHLVGKPRES